MKLQKSKILLINTVVSLLGVVIVFIGTVFFDKVDESKKKSVLDAIGIGLIASGGVNFLDKVFAQENKEDDISQVEILEKRRFNVDARIHKKKYSARNIDIVGVTLSSCLHQIVEDPRRQMIKNIFSGKTECLRLFFVNPNASFIIQRALEDGISVDKIKGRQKESIKMCVKFYKLLKDERDKRHHNHEINGNCNVEIRLIDFCPYITIERYDNESYWGLYTSDTVGLNSIVFKVPKQKNYELFEQLRKHFDGLQAKSLEKTKDNILLSMTLEELTLNESLVLDSLNIDKNDLEKLLM